MRVYLRQMSSSRTTCLLAAWLALLAWHSSEAASVSASNQRAGASQTRSFASPGQRDVGSNLQEVPETVIRSRPPPEISSCSARLTISSTSGVWGYETKLNDGPWTLGPQFKVQRSGSSVTLHGLVHQSGTVRTATVVPHTVAGLSSGEYILLVRTFNGLGQRDPTPEEISWRVKPVDTTITLDPKEWATPNSPIFFHVQSSAAKWAFEYRVDHGEWQLGTPYSLMSKAHYEVPYSHLHVTKHTDHTRHEKQIISAGEQGHHTLEVRAFNDCGEVGPIVSTAWKTSWVQTTMLRPPPSGTVGTSSVDFVVEVASSRPSFEYAVDGKMWQRPIAKPQPSSATMGIQVRVDGLSEGVHTLRVRSMDQQGRLDANPLEYQWSIDTTPPRTSVQLNSVPGQLPSEASFQWSCDDAAGCTYRYRLDSEEWIQTDRSFMRVGGLSPGSHELLVVAVDLAGNEDLEPVSFVWEVDYGPPITTIVIGPNKYTTERNAHFEFSTSKDNCQIFYSLDGGNFAEARGNALGLYELTDGTHRLRVYSSDAFGRVEPSPSVYTWVVDTLPPVTVVHQWFFSPNEPAAAILSVGVSMASAPDVASELIFDYQYQICTSGSCSMWMLGPKGRRIGPGYELRVTGLQNGTNRVAVRASDRAGNTDPTPVILDLHYEEPRDPENLLGNDSRTRVHSRSLQQEYEMYEAEVALQSDESPAASPAGWLDFIISWIMGSSSGRSAPHADLRRRLRREL